MNFGKLAPWNWFKKEENVKSDVIPTKRSHGVSEISTSFQNIETEFNNLLDSIKHNCREVLSKDLLFTNDWLKPALDIASNEKEYSVKIELPGIDKSKIVIEYVNSTLKIKGEKHQEKEEQNKDFYRIERSYGLFERILDLPEDCDADNISSEYKDGILSIKIPRKVLAHSETKKIEIKTIS